MRIRSGLALMDVLRPVSVDADLVGRAMRRLDWVQARRSAALHPTLKTVVEWTTADGVFVPSTETVRALSIAALQATGVASVEAEVRINHALVHQDQAVLEMVLRAIEGALRPVQCRAVILAGYVSPGESSASVTQQELDLLPLQLTDEYAQRRQARATARLGLTLPGKDIVARVLDLALTRRDAAGDLRGFRGAIPSDEMLREAGWASPQDKYPHNLRGPAEVVDAWANIFAACAQSASALQAAQEAAASQGVTVGLPQTVSMFFRRRQA